MPYTYDDLQELLKRHREIITYNIDQDGNLSMIPSWAVKPDGQDPLNQAFFDTLYEQAEKHGYKERKIQEGTLFEALKNRKKTA